MKRVKSIEIIDLNKYKKIASFLRSKATNSEQTRRVYTIALSYFQIFLKKEYQNDIQGILTLLSKKKPDVYELLNGFVQFLLTREDPNNANTRLSPASIWLYVTGAKSYLEFYDIDISRTKFKNRVTIPKKAKRIKKALDAQDVRDILLACNNDRLKAYLLCLASSGMRSNEPLSLRNCDVVFDSPTRVHLMAENTKTNTDCDVYISDEATTQLKKFLVSKYGSMEEFMKYPNHYLFSMQKNDSVTFRKIYDSLFRLWVKLLKKVEMAQRRQGQGIQRREIQFGSLRDFVKSTVAIHTNTDFSKWLVSHSASTYWSVSEQVRKDLYLKCMKYLTFLEYTTVEAIGKDFEAKLEERDKEIEELKEVGKSTKEELLKVKQELQESRRDWLKAMAGHVVMESDLDSKGRTKRKIIKNR